MALIARAVTASVRVPGGRLALVGYAALAGVVGFWTWRALNDPVLLLFGDSHGFYMGGQVAWATGHPEHLSGWTGTPLFALVMAVTSRLVSFRTWDHLLTALNVGLVVAVVAVVLRRLRGTLSPAWWWIAAAALLSFGPVMATVWWKQVNIIALVLAVGGFELVRRRRTQTGAALIGLSLAFKPLAILLPFVLLARRDTRRAGAWALGCVLVVTLAAQAVLAAHAHSASALNPLTALQNFDHKTRPAPANGFTTGWACNVSNFAPGSILCRLAGTQHATLQRVVALAGVALLAIWVISALRGRKATSWEVFAFTCAISPMLSPIDWAHYQIMLAPLFVLLVVRFTRDGAEPEEWAGLAVAFVLASLTWGPYNTPIDVVRNGFPGRPAFDYDLIAFAASFAQYVLILTGVLWYRGRRDVAGLRAGLTPVADSL
jgi:hypothetical protein